MNTLPPVPSLAPPVPSLADLAVRIRSEHADVVATLQRSFQHAMAAGDLLIAAKAQLKHGTWLPWLADNCGISERTAQVYTRLAKNRETLEAKTAGSADLTVDGALKLLAAPKPDAVDATASYRGVTLPFGVAQHLQNHPLADIIPDFVGFGFDILVRSIREHGLTYPIILFEGKILDGRARYKACRLAGVEPRFKELPEGDNPVDFLWSANVCRGHLSEDQQVVLFVEQNRLSNKIAGTKLLLSEPEKIEVWIALGGTEAEYRAIGAIDCSKLTEEMIIECADEQTREAFYVALAEATNA